MAALRERGADDLDVVEAVVARRLEGTHDAVAGDDALAKGDARRGAEVVGRLIVDLHQEDAVGAARDVVIEVPLDPSVVHFEEDAEMRRVDPVGEVEGVVEGVAEAEVVTEAGVRLQGHARPVVADGGEELVEERDELLLGLLVAELSAAAREERHALRAHAPGQVRRPLAALDLLGPLGAVVEREHAGARRRGDGEAGVGEQLEALVDAEGLQLHHRYGEAVHAEPLRQLDVVVEGQAVAHQTVEREFHSASRRIKRQGHSRSGADGCPGSLTLG